MAQTGYTPILIYASGTTGNTPLAADLTSNTSGAELALNYFDGKLFYKDAVGVVQVLATKGASTIGGSNTQVQYNSGGSLAGSANLTFNGTTLSANTLSLTNALATTSGGTGLTSFTANQVFYASSTSAIGQSANLTFNGTTLTVNDFTDSSLTSGRVTFAGTGGNLTDSANLTFNGTTLTANTLNLTTVLATNYGGTGLTTFTSGGAVYATSTSALTTGTLPIASGGTGQTTATAALNALGGINTGKSIAMAMIFGG